MEVSNDMINVFSINLNPLGKNDVSLSRAKRLACDACIRSFLESYNIQSELDIVSYSYNMSSLGLQSEFLEYLVSDAISSCTTTVFIFGSLADINYQHDSGAVRMLLRWYKKPGFHAYITNFSCEREIRSYQEELLAFSHYYIENIVPQPETRNAPRANSALMEYALQLRSGKEPVSYSEIERITGIKKQTLHSHLRREITKYNGNKSTEEIGLLVSQTFNHCYGRDMTAEEIAKVSSIVKKEKKRIMNSVSKYPDILD